MTCARWLLITTIILISVSRVNSAVGKTNTHGLSIRGGESIIEGNPNYVHQVIDEDDNDLAHEESDSSDDSEFEVTDEYDEEEGLDAKQILNNLLSKSNKQRVMSLNFIKKNKSVITMLLIIFAFRREIYGVILSATTTLTSDGRRKLKFKINATSILKVIMFIELMRNMIPNDEQTEDGQIDMSQNSGGPIGSLIGDLIKPSFSAFLPPVEQHYTFERINDRYKKDGMAFQKALSSPKFSGSSILSQLFSRRNKLPDLKNIVDSVSRAKTEENILYNSTKVILDWQGLDTSVSQMEVLRDQISYLVIQHRENVNLNQKIVESRANLTQEIHQELPVELEIIILLESPGGSASDYGLAASQIGRLRKEPGIKVTICVDKVAASGGYMMACMSTPGQLFSAPFAIVGSIGVIGQTFNIHNTLQNWGVKPLVFRAGKAKAPVGLIGEVTKDGMDKVQDMVDGTHAAFIRHVVNARPKMADNIDVVSTGDVWLGVDALEAGLVDRIITSDEYIGEKICGGSLILKLRTHRPRTFLFGMPLQSLQYGPSRMISSTVDFIKDCRNILTQISGRLVLPEAIGNPSLI